MFRVSEEHFVYRNEMKAIGICYAEIFLDNNKTIVVFTDVHANPGPSVINSIDSITQQFCKAKDLEFKEIIVIEQRHDSCPNLDIVPLSIFGEDDKWRRLSEHEAEPLIAALKIR